MVSQTIMSFHPVTRKQGEPNAQESYMVVINPTASLKWRQTTCYVLNPVFFKLKERSHLKRRVETHTHTKSQPMKMNDNKESISKYVRTFVCTFSSLILSYFILVICRKISCHDTSPTVWRMASFKLTSSFHSEYTEAASCVSCWIVVTFVLWP